MIDITTLYLTALIALALGAAGGYYLLKRVMWRQRKKIEDKGKSIIKEATLTAENIRKDKILEAKEKFIKMKSDFEEEAARKKNQIISNESKLRQREQNLSKQMEHVKRKEDELESSRENLTAQLEIVKKKKNELEDIKDQQITILEKISNLTADEARNQLMETLKDEARSRASSFVKDIMEEAQPRNMRLKIAYLYSTSRATTLRERLSEERVGIYAHWRR